MSNYSHKDFKLDNRLKSAWVYSTIFCVAVYFGWTFGLNYFVS
ncbi:MULTISPECIES: hypothetical protein [Shewanella]|nr:MULTISPECIES: hypothetical protein [Shewanella]